MATVDAWDDEVTREPDLDGILHGCVEWVRGAISIDVEERVRRLDAVLSCTGPSKIVRSGD